MQVTVKILVYYGGFPVGVATRQVTGDWRCRSLVDPYEVELATAVVDTERKAVRFLNQNRWARSLKKIRVLQRDDLAPK